MKKTFIVTILALLITAGVVSAKQLWEYGDFDERTIMALECGVVDDVNEYYGNYEQNIALLSCYSNNELGGAPVTATTWSLATPHTSSATIIDLTDVNDIRGNAVATSSLPVNIYLGIEAESRDNFEIVKCPRSGFDQVNSKFNSCTRGLAFSGTATTAVTANKKAHPAGASANMTNVGVFFTEFGWLNEANAWQSINTYSVYPEGPGSAPTTSGQLADKLYVDTVGAGGFTSSNIGDGETLRANGTSPETLDINTSTDDRWFWMDSDGFFALNTTTGKGVDTFWNNRHNATTTKSSLTITHNATTTGWFTVGSTVSTNGMSAGDLFVGGNATSVGSLSIGELCFNGANCTNSLTGVATSSGSLLVTETSSTTFATYTFTSADTQAGDVYEYSYYFDGSNSAEAEQILDLVINGVPILIVTQNTNDSDFMTNGKIVFGNSKQATVMQNSTFGGTIPIKVGESISARFTQWDAYTTTTLEYATEDIIANFRYKDSNNNGSTVYGFNLIKIK